MNIFYRNVIKNENKIKQDNCHHDWGYTDMYGGTPYRRICFKCKKQQYRKFNNDLRSNIGYEHCEWLDELDDN